MERGFLKNGSRKGKGKNNVGVKLKDQQQPGVDRLSHLPKPLIHHIFSFLDLKQVVQTSVLSQKWRNLWISLHVLNIDCEFWKGEDGNVDNDKFQEFVYKVLLHRDGSNIQKFCLTCDRFTGLNQVGHLYTWVASAVRRHVEDLQLQTMFTPPLFAFSSSTSLKTLRLVNATLPIQVEGNWLGPSLETLIIENCRHHYLQFINVSSSQLKYFGVKNNGDCEFFGPSFCELKICAPNLTSLECTGHMYKDYSLENLTSLVTAQVDTKMVCQEDMREAMGRCLNKILRGLGKAKSLTLSVEGVQAFAQLPKLFKPVPIALCNLKILKLKEWYDNGYIHALAKLFGTFSCIETLILQRTKVSSKPTKNAANKEVNWGKLLDFDCKLYKLKSVEMLNLKGCENELRFIEFILKNAMVLENITIITTKVQSIDRQKALAKFSQKLQSLPKASSSATLTVLHNK